MFERGVDIIPIKESAKAAFQAKNPLTGRPTFYFGPDATVLQVKHELSHYLDWKRLGPKAYGELTPYAKEKMVLDRLKQNRVWDQLATEEKLFSVEYVQNLKPKPNLANKNGAQNVK